MIKEPYPLNIDIDDIFGDNDEHNPNDGEDWKKLK